jgi:5-methylcytosine-specific restriction protein A
MAEKPLLKMLGTVVGVLDPRVAKPAEKTVDPLYNTPEYRKWREIVVSRARGRCEWVENGRRCNVAEPRMIADHIIEVRDDGAKFDPANGQCLCFRHHTIKTNRERDKRLKAVVRASDGGTSQVQTDQASTP